MARRRLIAYTVIAWAIACCFCAYYYVTSILSLPHLDLGYERDWHFQLLMFFIFRFPLLLMALITLVALEIRATKNTKTI